MPGRCFPADIAVMYRALVAAGYGDRLAEVVTDALHNVHQVGVDQNGIAPAQRRGTGTL